MRCWHLHRLTRGKEHGEDGEKPHMNPASSAESELESGKVNRHHQYSEEHSRPALKEWVRCKRKHRSPDSVLGIVISSSPSRIQNAMTS